MKNTGIRIETIKEVNGAGEAGYRITAIAALERGDLPLMYLVGNRPDVFLRNDHLVVRSAGDAGTCIYINDFFTQEDMKKINAHIKAAGQHLADANRELAEKRAAWQGKVVFVDGVVESPKTVLRGKPGSKSAKVRPWEPWLQPAEPLTESVLDSIPKLWVAGNLFYKNKKGQIKPFPKPEIEK